MITFADQADLDAYVRRVLVASIEEHAPASSAAALKAAREAGMNDEGAGFLASVLGADHAVFLAAANRLPLPKVPR